MSSREEVEENCKRYREYKWLQHYFQQLWEGRDPFQYLNRERIVRIWRDNFVNPAGNKGILHPNYSDHRPILCIPTFIREKHQLHECGPTEAFYTAEQLTKELANRVECDIQLCKLDELRAVGMVEFLCSKGPEILLAGEIDTSLPYTEIIIRFDYRLTKYVDHEQTQAQSQDESQTPEA